MSYFPLAEGRMKGERFFDRTHGWENGIKCVEIWRGDLMSHDLSE